MTISNKIIPSGIYSPVTTFFEDDPENSLDLESQVEHAKMLYTNGITGLLVSGSLGECVHLSIRERYNIVSAIRAAIPDENFKLISGAPPLGCIREAIEESKSAFKAGADFIILLVPGYFGPSLTSQQGIIEYFTKIADESSLPIIIYNYPGTCNNVTLTIETYEALSLHPNIVGVKLTHFDMDLYTLVGNSPTIRKANFKAFTGLGQILVPAMSVGISGAIDGLSALFPKVMVKLFNLIKEGNIQEASRIQYFVTRAERMIAEMNVIGVKYALKEIYGYGKFLGGRPPLNNVSLLGSYKKYKLDLETLAQLEKSL
ncbi:uncharacterized protein PRCAT00003516001 [Priceomyces carsonii]|uniref:uncharacterized protein n=1 Tax=Priceomyces carsonii TaxID=28549 RepID=UPI002ED8D48E|nr:unnamed protein product [Priceomyces carsonii]